jgi:low affinity Fe/Cu permease
MTSNTSRFDRIATAVSEAVGSSGALGVFVASVLLWLAVGPLFGWSNGWQLLINTPTTIVTTGLVILVQYTQNKNDRAIHLKLDVLIDASEAENEFAAVEDMDDQQLKDLRDRVEKRIAGGGGDDG